MGFGRVWGWFGREGRRPKADRSSVLGLRSSAAMASPSQGACAELAPSTLWAHGSFLCARRRSSSAGANSQTLAGAGVRQSSEKSARRCLRVAGARTKVNVDYASPTPPLIYPAQPPHSTARAAPPRPMADDRRPLTSPRTGQQSDPSRAVGSRLSVFGPRSFGTPESCLLAGRQAWEDPPRDCEKCLLRACHLPPIRRRSAAVSLTPGNASPLRGGAPPA